MFKLFRIDYEWNEYMGAGEWDTHKRYLYVLGERQLGKACYDLMNDDNQLIWIWRLDFSLRGLWICWRKTDSQFQNLTKH